MIVSICSIRSVNKTDSTGYHVFVCILFLSLIDTLNIESNYYEMVSHDILMRISYTRKFLAGTLTSLAPSLPTYSTSNYVKRAPVMPIFIRGFASYRIPISLSTRGHIFHIDDTFPQMLSEYSLCGMGVCFGSYIHSLSSFHKRHMWNNLCARFGLIMVNIETLTKADQSDDFFEVLLPTCVQLSPASIFPL